MLDRAFGFMGHARDKTDGLPGPGAGDLHLLFPGDEHSVRDALKTSMHALRAMAIDPDLTGVAEIVLAEVLNNVVEHAYASHGRGVIELEVEKNGSGLDFCIRDDGVPMPDGDLPHGKAHDLDVATEDLPEGGFGWLMIRELTRNLRYRRTGNRNELRFHMPAQSGAGPH